MSDLSVDFAQRLMKLSGDATPGPWLAINEPDRESWITAEGTTVMERPEPMEAGGLTDADAELIVYLRNRTEAILTLVRASHKLEDAVGFFSVLSPGSFMATPYEHLVDAAQAVRVAVENLK